MSHTKLTDEQRVIFQEVFSLYDRKDNGTIRTKDIKKVLKCLGCHFVREERKLLMCEVDPKGNGLINFTQFLEMMSRNLKETQPTLDERCREVFYFFDIDRKGFITMFDLRQAMISLGENLQFEVLYQMIEEASIKGNGQVSYEEFLRLVKSMPENSNVINCKKKDK